MTRVLAELREFLEEIEMIYTPIVIAIQLVYHLFFRKKLLQLGHLKELAASTRVTIFFLVVGVCLFLDAHREEVRYAAGELLMLIATSMPDYKMLSIYILSGVVVIAVGQFAFKFLAAIVCGIFAWDQEDQRRRTRTPSVARREELDLLETKTGFRYDDFTALCYFKTSQHWRVSYEAKALYELAIRTFGDILRARPEDLEVLNVSLQLAKREPIDLGELQGSVHRYFQDHGITDYLRSPIAARPAPAAVACPPVYQVQSQAPKSRVVGTTLRQVISDPAPALRHHQRESGPWMVRRKNFDFAIISEIPQELSGILNAVGICDFEELTQLQPGSEKYQRIEQAYFHRFDLPRIKRALQYHAYRQSLS